MAKNVDKNQVFEFLRVASLDSQNIEARKEAYWIICYIFLKKTLSVDIAESLAQQSTDENGTVVNGSKVSQMLKDVDTRVFSFEQGFIECNGKKVSLEMCLTMID